MNIFYLANIRLPTEKAHGLTIVKTCDAFAREGASVTLIVPRRKTHIQTNVYETYGVQQTFLVRTVPTIDWLYTHGQWASWLASAFFTLGAFFLLLFSTRKNGVIYTREVSVLPLAVLRTPVILESHHVFSKRSIYFILARFARGVVVISRALKDTFLQAGFAEADISVEPSGVDLATFSSVMSRADARSGLSLPPDVPIILYSGNFTTMGEDKGIHDILLAMQGLQEVLFVAVGGSERDRARYGAETLKLGVSERVRFIGFVQQQVLAQYQRAADVLLMPFPDTPHYRSNMSPVKMFEYMASGKPIIATDLPTIREVLHEHNAMIIPPGDSDALAGAVRTLINDSALGEKLAIQAKEEVARYDWSERARRILAFIETRL